MTKYAPLPQSVLLTGLMGFLLSAIFTYSGKIGLSWGFAFMLVFLVMIIASFISMAPDYDDFR
ncbi:hypothetical protein HN695_00855 [Candidatus Woesearchaeota archaeon]|jgi:hypothetical protein|nr:hypothetical protein [Candidatus Woesearchaeota archaeon]MBT5272777.1 hypothetical protein [Candidatus Woesearchaeota archaeon]MBT6040389.1 hypothetical protein [Candidatus Woesearchaeota archaeon]MBT6336978.1 hypothetical protein [Candidatus Woesearchaeota archaeon]MBT7926864.1 hypothetical protein [Candidatus Woesearchaeota archaeon]